MVESTVQPYSIPLRNEGGYVLFFPQVQGSLDLVQNPHPDPYAQSVSKLYPLGTKLMRGEQVWRYCYNGDVALTIAATLESSTTPDAAHEDDAAVTTNAAVGDTTIYITGSANLDASPADEINEFEDGYIYFNLTTAAGAGQCRKIKSNAAFGSSGATEFKLYEALTVAITAGTTTAGMSRNPYRMVIASTTSGCAGVPVGVPGIPVDINYYFWSQTGGPCAVNPQAANSLGDAVIIGTTAGQSDPISAATAELRIGYPLTPGVTDGECFLCFLTIDR